MTAEQMAVVERAREWLLSDECGNFEDTGNAHERILELIGVVEEMDAEADDPCTNCGKTPCAEGVRQCADCNRMFRQINMQIQVPYRGATCNSCGTIGYAGNLTINKDNVVEFVCGGCETNRLGKS